MFTLFSPNQPANSVFLSQQTSTSQSKSAQKSTSEQAGYSSHHIESYVYGILNVDEKKLIAQFGWKSRDERFEPRGRSAGWLALSLTTSLFTSCQNNIFLSQQSAGTVFFSPAEQALILFIF